jgi:DNA polymerase-3 subunit beta
MKVVCKKDDLAEIFSIVNSVIPLRSTIPILQNIKIATNANSLLLIGTDLEIGIKAEIKAEIKEKGSVLIPTQKLGNIIRETTDSEIKLETDGTSIYINTSDGEYKIIGADPADYPTFPESTGKNVINIDTYGLKEMIHKTIFAISAEITRYALTGLLLEIRKKEIRLVGSDGKRLAFIKRQSEQIISQEKKVIIPAKGMNLLEKILKEKQKLELNIEENQIIGNITSEKEKITIFSRLVEGTFPDYENIIPNDCNKKIEIKSEQLYAALRKVTIVTTDKFKATKLSLKENKIRLTSKTQEVGEAKIEINAKYTGEPIEIVFNPDLFIDVLRVLGDTDLTIELKDKTSPAVFKKGKDYTYLVMPMTIDI